MPQQVRGVVARSKVRPSNSPRSTSRIRTRTTWSCGSRHAGVCHTDLTYRDGINGNFPFLLGHEAAGIVESAGTAVTHVERRRLRRAQVEEAFATVHRGEVLRSVVVL